MRLTLRAQTVPLKIMEVLLPWKFPWFHAHLNESGWNAPSSKIFLLEAAFTLKTELFIFGGSWWDLAMRIDVAVHWQSWCYTYFLLLFPIKTKDNLSCLRFEKKDFSYWISMWFSFWKLFPMIHLPVNKLYFSIFLTTLCDRTSIPSYITNWKIKM